MTHSFVVPQDILRALVRFALHSMTSTAHWKCAMCYDAGIWINYLGVNYCDCPAGIKAEMEDAREDERNAAMEETSTDDVGKPTNH
jgi:hypothetical protein